jgi:hypothetical protein
MEVSAQELRLHDARNDKVGFLAAILGAFAIAAAICNGATPPQSELFRTLGNTESALPRFRVSPAKLNQTLSAGLAAMGSATR